MIILLLLLVSLYLHCWDDFHHQGCLKEMKRKKWWREHPQYNDMYENDYKICMMVHAFEWTCAVHAPYVIYLIYIHAFTDCAVMITLTSMFGHLLTHARIDSFKANDLAINLVQDQAFHICQLIMIAITNYALINGFN